MVWATVSQKVRQEVRAVGMKAEMQSWELASES